MDDVPSSINWHNFNELLRFFRQRAEGTFTQPVFRAIVLGEPAVGRTTVAKKIAGADAVCTLSDESVMTFEGRLSPMVAVSVCDFDSRVISGPSHQFFIVADSVFVLVASLIQATSLTRLEYWMDLICSKVSNPLVVVVVTHADRVASPEAELDRLRERFIKGRKKLRVQAIVSVHGSRTPQAVWEQLRAMLAAYAQSLLTQVVGRSFSNRAAFFMSMIEAERGIIPVPIMSLSSLKVPCPVIVFFCFLISLLNRILPKRAVGFPLLQSLIML